MKPNRKNLLLAAIRLSFPLVSALTLSLSAPTASAVTYYWDNNGTGAGFGTAAGTWEAPTTGSATQGWSQSATGVTLPVDVTTATTDTVNFGNGATGLAAGTITVSGTVSTGNMTFASGSGGITLSGGTINLGGSRTITSSYTAGVNVTRAITSELALSGASTFTIGDTGSGGGTRQLTLGVLSGTGGTTFQYTGGNNGFGLILLNGASTYTGTTLISTSLTNANTEVRLGVIDALPTTTVLTLGGANGTGTGGRDTKLNLNGKNQTLAGLATTGGGSERNYIISSSSAATLTVNDAGARTCSGRIGTDGTAINIVKGGAGTWTLTGANTYTGTTTLNQGAITVGTGGTLGATTGSLTVNNNNNTGVGTAAVLNLATAVDTTKGSLSGTIATPSSGTNTATINTQTSRTLTINQTAAGTYDGVIAGAGNFTLGSLSTNALTLSGLSTFTGNVTVSAGTLIANNTETASAGPLGAANNTRTITVGSGATLQLAQAKALKALFNSANVPSLIINGSVNNTNLSNPGNNPLGNLTLNNGTLTASIGHPNYGGYNLNNTVTSTGTSLISSTDVVLGRMMLNSGGSFITPIDVTSGTLTISAPLAEVTVESAVSGLTKTGAGTLVLSGVNTYTGATTLNAGTLSVDGSISNSTLALNSGTLTGSGTVGAVNVANSVGAIISNNNGSPGASLTTGALTFNGAATVNTFSASTSAPVIAGALSTDLAGLVTINAAATSWVNGTYNLISYTGGSIGGAGFGQFVLGTVTGVSARATKILADSGTAITLTLAGDNPYWTGAANGNWNTTDTNWKLVTAGTNTQFIDTDVVLFNDLGTNTTIDINAANVALTSVTFNNTTAVPYTIGSTGGFGITSGSLTKNNTGTVTLSNNNTYTGATVITGGTLNLTGSLTGTVITVSGSGVLSENSSGVIGGAVSLTHSSSGTSTLAGINTYTGTTTLNGGILRATTSASALGAGTLVLAGGVLQLANDTGLSFGRDTTVTGNTQITSDTLTAVAGVTQTLGTLSIGGQTLSIAKGSNATGTTAGVSFGASTLTGAPTFSIGTDSALNLAAVTNAGNTITLTGAGNFSQTGTLSGVGGLDLNSGFSGTATLSGASTNYSGATTISGGKLVLAGTTSSTAFASAVTVNAGGTLQYSPTATNNQAGVGAISLLGTLTYAPASNFFQVLGTSGANKIVTVSGGASVINISPGGTFAASTGGLYLDGGLQGSSDLTVNATTDGFGLVLRTAGSTYSGTMIVNGNANIAPGTGSGLVLNGSAVNPTLSNANLTINGTLELGDSNSGMGWAATGTINGTTQSINALNGTGVVVANMETAASTRTLSVGNNGGTGSFSGVIASGTNSTLGFTKAGSGTQTLSGLSSTAANNYSGITTVDNGTLAFTTTNPSLTAGLRFGSAATNTTPGIFDLTTTNPTFAGALLVNTNSATASEIKIGAARTLTFNGNVQIGATTPVTGINAVSRLNLTGGGTFNVATAAAGTFFVGGSTLTSTTTSQDSTLDLTALSSTTINTSTTGTIRVSAGSSSNVAGYKSTLLLPTPVVADTVATATLTAGTIGVGVGSGFNSAAGQINTLQLGTGLTTLNADTINVGTGSRDIGQIIFGQAGGDVKIRAADGTSRATALNVGTGGATTATAEATTNNLVDFSSHDADILVTSLNVGNQARVGTVLTSEFKFGAGGGSLTSTLDATNVNIGFRTGTATSPTILTNRVAINGGIVTFGNVGATGTGVDIGNSTYSGAGAASTIGELNISGGNVTINNGTGGYAVRLGSNVVAGGGTVTSSLNLTGGTTTLGGDIVRGITSPRTTSAVNISGASAILDLAGNDIGTATELITLTAESGELKNVLSINGTGGLTKTTPGILTVSGTNTYTGATTISDGTLALGADNALPANPVSIGTATLNASTFDDSLGTLDVTGSAVINLGAGANLVFADSSGITWTGPNLNITGTFVSGSSLNFGVGGLLPAQLALITVNGVSAAYTLNGAGFLIAPAGGSNYASWANDVNKGNIPGQPPTGDFDNDGLSNIVEYALGKNPRVSSQPAGVLSGNGTVITYTKGSDAITNGDISWVIETSTTLAPGSWTPEPVIAGPTVTYTFTPGTPARKFARLKVTQVP